MRIAPLLLLLAVGCTKTPPPLKVEVLGQPPSSSADAGYRSRLWSSRDDTDDHPRFVSTDGRAEIAWEKERYVVRLDGEQKATVGEDLRLPLIVTDQLFAFSTSYGMGSQINALTWDGSRKSVDFQQSLMVASDSKLIFVAHVESSPPRGVIEALTVPGLQRTPLIGFSFNFATSEVGGVVFQESEGRAIAAIDRAGVPGSTTLVRLSPSAEVLVESLPFTLNTMQIRSGVLWSMVRRARQTWQPLGGDPPFKDFVLRVDLTTKQYTLHFEDVAPESQYLKTLDFGETTVTAKWRNGFESSIAHSEPKAVATAVDAAARAAALLELRSYISADINKGFTSREWVIDGAADVVGSSYPQLDLRTEATRITDELLEARKREEQTWTSLTDCDRLDLAFAALERRGIVARQDFSDCQTCGAKEIRAEMANEKKRGRKISGYVFFHDQSGDRLLEGKLGLSFGAAEENDDGAALKVADVVVEELKKAGLKPVWEKRYAELPIGLKLEWKKRWFTKAPAP